ncbi:MAG: hypothetical protein JOY93_11645 [Acidobacteriales bacterium]|nr:hypothetical protein [Terriglobales bacterium]
MRRVISSISRFLSVLTLLLAGLSLTSVSAQAYSYNFNLTNPGGQIQAFGITGTNVFNPVFTLASATFTSSSASGPAWDLLVTANFLGSANAVTNYKEWVTFNVDLFTGQFWNMTLNDTPAVAVPEESSLIQIALVGILLMFVTQRRRIAARARG